jgi:rhodanese-related sulfurtransferase
MKINRLIAIATIGLSAAAMAACGDSATDVTSVNESEVLLQYLESNRSYDVQGGFVIGASAVRTQLVTDPSRYHIIDIRSQTDFAKGQIPGATQVDFANLLTYVKGMSPAASSYERIVITCYSGQSSAYAVGLLRALGYTNAISLKWGMSAWHDDFAGPWKTNISNARATQFVSEASPAPNPAGALPALNTGRTTGAEILEARAAQLFAAGYSSATVNHNSLFQNLNGHYIVNFWPPNLYQTPGHIPGAINYDPAGKPFESGTLLKTLSTTKPSVIYCYTGQTSSYLAAFLRLLGYDAKSLLYGANGMIYDLMSTHGVPNRFSQGEVMNYEYAK